MVSMGPMRWSEEENIVENVEDTGFCRLLVRKPLESTVAVIDVKVGDPTTIMDTRKDVPFRKSSHSTVADASFQVGELTTFSVLGTFNKNQNANYAWGHMRMDLLEMNVFSAGEPMMVPDVRTSSGTDKDTAMIGSWIHLCLPEAGLDLEVMILPHS